MYRFLGSEVRCYLPDYDLVTVWHLRDLASNKRRRIHQDDVKILQLPFYEGLSIAEILDFAQAYDNGSALMALPEVKKEILKLHREYIVNTIYTMLGEPFMQWTKAQIEKRNQKRKVDRDMVINLDP